MVFLKSKDYITEVQNYSGTVLLFFTAIWAQPAIKTATYLRTTSSMIKILSVDYDDEDSRELVQKFSVRQLPTVIVLKNGQVTNIGDTCENDIQLAHILG